MDNFCPECNNLLYFKEEDNELLKYCKRCGFKIISNETIIDTTDYNNSDTSSSKTYNPFAIYDSRLGRTTKIKCINNMCLSIKNSDKQEIVLIKNRGNLRSKYMCVLCKTEWS
jgi:DNA-directed RNA polymerase subunit M/transcription elongation factor TFIIS